MNPQEFDQQFRKDPKLWKGMVLNLCREKGLPTEPFEPFLTGTNLIAAVGGTHVVKIFPVWLRHQWESDRLVLKHLQNRLSIPTPCCLLSGELENGWTFLVMNKLPGQTLEDYWPSMSLENKANVLLRIGHLMAEVKSIPAQGLDALQPRWDAFLANQLGLYKNRHEKNGMPDWFLREVDAYVQKHLHLIPQYFRPTLLTGEYTPFNLMAIKRANEVELSGMIDFGDAMVGFAPYDLLGPSLFLGEGHPLLIRSLFQGYGETPSIQLLMLLQILHRFSDFSAQLRIPCWQEKARSMSDFEGLIWPF